MKFIYHHFRYLAIPGILFFLYSFGYGQISNGGIPESFNCKSLLNPKSVQLESVNLEELYSEDVESQKYGSPLRFAVSIKVEIDLSSTGSWYNNINSQSICLLNVKSNDAQGIIFYYSEFEIPEGGKLFIYSKDKKQIIGAFDSNTNPKKSHFATELIIGEEAIIEYNSGFDKTLKPNIVISEIGIAYRTLVKSTDGFGGSGPCEVNINCEEGLNWQTEKRAVSRIIVKQGSSSYWCTGSLINNVRQDFKPYLLTADHCGFTSTPIELNQWIFYFKYEGPNCEDPLSDSSFNSFTIIGATKIASAGRNGADIRSDFKLLLLNESVPSAYNPYFLGWSTADTGSSSGIVLHHPQGDILKVSTYNTPLISTSWSNTPNTHWRVNWFETPNGFGVTEGGSSGSPILDAFGRLLGTLTGGEATCNSPTLPDYFGKFSYSWNKIQIADSTKLQPWLDPDNTGISVLEGGWLGFEKLKLNASFLTLFPNPVIDQLMMKKTDFQNQIGKFYIYNSMGDLVFSKDVLFGNQGEILMNTEIFTSGLYLVSVKVKNDMASGKFMIRK